MRHYEAVVIFDAGAEPPAIQAVIERVTQTVADAGGTPGNIDRWGRRQFAYEVGHKREGYYVMIEFTAEQPTVGDLDRLLALADEVVRHKLIRIPDKVARRRSEPAAAPAVS
jgi:small subunit ribosomal protein S6